MFGWVKLVLKKMIHEVIVMTLLDTKIARPALQTANVLEDPFQPSVTRSGPVMEVFDDDVMLYIFFRCSMIL